MTVGSNSPNSAFWVPKFNIMERIQLMGFCLQEFFISTLYIVATVRLLGSIYHSMTRKVMMQLLLVNGICIGMDVILIGLEFSGEYVGEASIKPMIYAIKLKLEFAVLNQLMGLTKAGFTEENQFRGGSARHGYNNGAASHEMNGRHHGSVADPETGAGGTQRSMGKNGTWTTARAIRGSFAGTHNQHANNHPEHIFQTKQVEITTAPKSPSNADISNSSTSSTIAPAPTVTSNASTAIGHQRSITEGPKANSLMGTNIVHMPNHDAGRVGRRSRTVDPDGRESSPVSEGEKGILRRSQDSEKEGTRWIDGMDR
ncbi:uncharacterized protein KY384_008380 [Bacidia gigantensis]|uniref:uncharacterized protein n=1 Tax=Bacidia gigantensis TaxID=2732470 RepID=UPI001D058336|nr:uncharacterized protein KY384_008380 [Bacidia gigantensis]KAG8526951.1 hypothetical protein KY384_008380 [Bacidia gigantensis]